MFCIINFISVAYLLNLYNYNGHIKLNIIDEQNNNSLFSSKNVSMDEYKNIYEEVLVNNNKVRVDEEIIQNGISNYFFNINHTSNIDRLISNNLKLSDEELLKLCLKNNNQSGLGDVQILKLIKYYHK